VPASRKRLVVARIVPYLARARNQRLFDDVRTFLLFVGHGRSGGTLVGSILNAHPNVVLTNELDALDYLERGLSREQLFHLIRHIDKRLVRKGSTGGGGYTYAVPNQWQGRHREILVIGDRKAGATALEVSERPQLLDTLRRVVGGDIRFVNVVRNPYDNIVTMFRKTIRRPGEPALSHLRRQIGMYFLRCAAVRTVAGVFGDDHLHRVYHEELVARAPGTLSSLCVFLGLDAPVDYLRDCASIVESTPRRTRAEAQWTPELVDLVAQRMQEFPWLGRYRFEEGSTSG